MPNTLGYYNPAFYAQEALIQLEKALGMAGRVHRGYERERRGFNLGDTINIKRPSNFTAQDAPSTAQDAATDSVSFKLTNWKEVKFSLTDKELAYTGEQIINDHIRPAAVALADNIDQALAGLYTDVPWYYTTNASPGTVVADLTGPRKVMFDNKVPLNDPSMLHYMVDSTMEANLLGNSAFSQWQGSGQNGVNTQQSGLLGPRYGFNFFANQNVKSHTTTAITNTTPAVTTTAAGATTVALSAGTLTGTLKKGDIILFSNHAQQYAVTADVTASGNAATVAISPPLQTAITNGATTWSAIQAAVDGVQRLAFHRNAFALALAPLPEIGNQLGAKIATVQDPITGLSIRSRLFYDGDASKVFVALDILYGLTTLDGNLAVRAVV
jgi:hypothetical protein